MSTRQRPRLTSTPPARVAALPVLRSLPCRRNDPELWFPVRAEEVNSDAYAQELCAGCPLVIQCLDYALTYPQHGVWGGMSERSRHNLIRRQHRAAASAAQPTGLAGPAGLSAPAEVAEVAS